MRDLEPGRCPLKVVLVSGDEDRFAVRINTQGGTLKFDYSGNGISSSISSDSRKSR